jgi:arsenite methyltransferase
VSQVGEPVGDPAAGQATRDSIVSDPAVVRRHRRLAGLLGARPGEVVADIGCGDAVTLAVLLEETEGVTALGLDLDPDGFAIAAERYGPLLDTGCLRLVLADLGAPLPLGDGTVDRLLSHNTLELLPAEAQDALLVEAHRVLRPGGRFVLSSPDWDTVVYAGADVAFTRRVVHAYADFQQSWMAAVDGTLGRALLAHVARSPFRTGRLDAGVVLSQGYDPERLGYGYANHMAWVLSAGGQLPGPELAAWLDQLAAAGERGEFMFSLNDYAVVCEKR